MISRRDVLKAAGGLFAAGLARRDEAGAEAAPSPTSSAVTIKDVEIGRDVVIQVDDGTRGSFAGSPSQDLKSLEPHWAHIRELLIRKDPFDPSLSGEWLWESVYPGQAKLYAEGRDPLTGESIANKPRGGRHTKTGQVFMAFSTMDIALWDLRARLKNVPAYRIIGEAGRKRLPVYWRPGEADQGLRDARRRAREAFDQNMEKL